MQMKKRTIAIALIAAGAMLGAAGAASANGCNGHVEQLRWGCAAWDNNNGPQYPYWQGNRSQARSQPQRVQIRPSTPAYNANRASMTRNLVNRNGSGVIAAGAGNVIPAGAGN